MQEFEYDLFLSHNRADKEWVRNLAFRLIADDPERKPFKVFFDEWCIRPGENIPIVLERALLSSRKIALVISPDSNRSAWVELERSVVTALDPANREFRLIPLLLAGTDAELPALVRPLKYIDFRSPNRFEESFHELVSSISESPTQPPATNLEKPVSVAPWLQNLLLSDHNYSCCACHTIFDIQIYRIDVASRNDPVQYDDAIPLCPMCLVRIRREGLSPNRLRAIRDHWRSLCKNMPKAITEADVEAAYSEAIRLSLSDDVWDVKRAIVKCRQIVHLFPFHADAQVLLHKLTHLEGQLDLQEARRDSLLRKTTEEVNHYLVASRALAWIALAWVIYFLSKYVVADSAVIRIGITASTLALTAIFGRRLIDGMGLANTIFFTLQEEYAHVLTAYFFSPIRNAFGMRMPLGQYLRYIEMDVDGVPITDDAGVPVRASIKRAYRIYRRQGKLPGFALNESRMAREFYTKIRL